MDTPKRKNRVAAAMGRKGGRRKVKKGFAMMDPAKLAELRARGAAARRKKAKVKLILRPSDNSSCIS